MSDSGMDVEGLNEVVELLQTNLGPALRVVAQAIAGEAQDRIAPYPAASGKKQAFKTTKQRRGFFARLRSGAIRVPYQRRGAGGGVAGGWQIQAQGDGAVLRNTRPEAAFVHAEKQATYFRGSDWKSTKGVAAEIQNDGTAGRMVTEAVQAAFDKGGNG